MKFEAVLPLLLSGKKIRRKGWPEGSYVKVGEHVITEYDTDFSPTFWEVLEEDWEGVA